MVVTGDLGQPAERALQHRHPHGANSPIAPAAADRGPAATFAAVRSVRIVGPGRAGSVARAGPGRRRRLGRRSPLVGRDGDVAGAARRRRPARPRHPRSRRRRRWPRAVEPVPDTVVAHLSGSLGLDVLGGHPRRASVHPLMALPDPDGRGPAADAAGGWFAVDGDPLAARGGRRARRPVVRGRRPGAAYHAAACIASNHLVALMGQVERVAAAAGVPFEAYLALARGSLDDVAAARAARRHHRTGGPPRRGDAGPAPRRARSLRARGLRRDGGARRPARGAGLMETVTRIAEARGRSSTGARAGGASVGLVPTMGYLHAGHASLIERAAAEHDVVAVTVFVNPLQFAPDRGPRGLPPRPRPPTRALIERCGGTLLIAPSVEEMYPEPVLTSVQVAEISERLEGASRPTHFAGVATVVAKLFSIAGPCHAYFGEKDWQQVAVVRRMARDLSFPVTVVACPTVREPDGLAMSSRNVYLTPEERAAAPVLHRALQAGADAIRAGARDPAAVEALVAELVPAEPRGRARLRRGGRRGARSPGRPAGRGGPPARGRPLRPGPADRQRGGGGTPWGADALDRPCAVRATSICSCWVRASPASRPRSGLPKGTGWTSACSRRGRSRSRPPAGPRAGSRRCCRATPTPPTCTSPTRWPPARACATPTRCGCSSTRARPGWRS